MNHLEQLFETYRGHDQTLSLIGYSSKMMSGLYGEETHKRAAWSTLSSQISSARVVLRLLDDVAMLNTTLAYGLGKHERNLIVRVLTIIDNLASHFYYLCEHVAWLADAKMLKVNSGAFWLASLIAWLISLLSSLVCNIIRLKAMYAQSKRAKDASSFRKDLLLVGIKTLKDVSWLINAIHWLPFKGFLWAGKLSNFTSGLAGVLAVSCNLISKMCF